MQSRKVKKHGNGQHCETHRLYIMCILCYYCVQAVAYMIVLLHPYSVLDDIKHIGPIADSMSEWEGAIGDALELTYADREAIKAAHPGRVNLQK